MTEHTEKAIEIIQKHEPPEGYHVAFSGGKDSTVVYDLVKKAGVKYKPYFCCTTIDPPELLRFIRKEYPEVIWLRPKLSMYKLIIKEECLPTRTMRFCCRYLKEYAGKNETVITGIRWEESNARAKRNLYEKPPKGKNKWFVHPIIEWEEWEVWEYIENNKLPICSLYDSQSRIGCIGCPMQYYKSRIRELNNYPRYKAMYIKAIRKVIEKGRHFQAFNSAEDVYEWWVRPENSDTYLRQYKIQF